MPTALAPQVLAEIEDTIEHFNANHPDTVLLLARFAAGCQEATDAEAVAVDTEGVDFAVRLVDGPSTARMPFDEAVTTSGEVSAKVMASIGVARQNAGSTMPITSMEAEMSTTGSLPTHFATVVSNRELTPNLRELVVEGEFERFTSLGQDQFVYVFVGRDGPLPDDYSMAQFMSEDPGTRPLGAYYTIRQWDPATKRILMWFVTHGHEGGVGGWSARAEPGERIALWGPRASFTVPDGATGHIFVTDESGFAAVAVRIEELPADAEVTVIAETIDEAHTLPLADPGRADVRWVFRGERAPGTGTGLIDAVRALDLDRPGLVAFGAGESKQMSAIRRLLRREHGFPADFVSMTGYWRHAKH